MICIALSVFVCIVVGALMFSFKDGCFGVWGMDFLSFERTPCLFSSCRTPAGPNFCASSKGNTMKLFHSIFATGIVVAASLFAVILVTPSGVAQASGLKSSSPLQLAQKADPRKAIAQCKSKCAKEYNSCVKGGCVAGSGNSGKCTSTEAIAGCNDKHGSKMATCQSRCEN